MSERHGPPLFSPRPVTELEAAFWKGCAERRLCFQRCEACGRWRHPPRQMCAACGSLDWIWAESRGRGQLFTWSTTHRAPHPSLAEHVPFATAVVELEEGVRLVSVVRDVPVAELALELRLKVDFEPASDGALLPVFLRDVP